ncbi:hypothetical protein CF319_g3285 [Tilletia indica]|nr:hypothetical protein CF319_g3285 [Tilletia indica]
MKRSAEDMLSSDKVDRFHAEQSSSSSSSFSSSSSTAAAAAALTLHSMSGSAGASSSNALSHNPSFSTTSAMAESSSAAQRRKLDGACSSSVSGPSSSAGHEDHRHAGGTCKIIDASSATAGTNVVPVTATEIHMEIDLPAAAEPGSSSKSAVAHAVPPPPPPPKKEKERAEANDDTTVPDAVAVAAKKETQLQLIIDELVCDICLELMVNPAALTPCQHVFCWSCAKVWMQDSSKCPTCATPVTHAHLNYKLAKLSELATALAPADRVRPAVEIEAAKTHLERHKAISGSSTIRATSHMGVDDPYRPELSNYWPCLACRPGNRSGFQCTRRIPEPQTNGPPPSRGAPWPLIEDADDDGLVNVEHHEACSGCYAWIPNKAPGIESRCFTCTEASCQAFDAEGSCPAGFSLLKLDDEDVNSSLDVEAIVEGVPLAGFNQVDKEILMRYVVEKDVSAKTILRGIAQIAKREREANLRSQAGPSATQNEESGVSSSTEASRPLAEAAAAEADVERVNAARSDLIRNVVRYEATRAGHRVLGQSSTFGSGRSQGASGSGSAGSSNSLLLQRVIEPTRIQGPIADMLATSSFCLDCLQGVIGHFAIWWWMEERPKALKEIKVAVKDDCDNGIECDLRTYRMHAEAKNHICLPKSKLSASSSQPSGSGSGSSSGTAASSSSASGNRTQTTAEADSSTATGGSAGQPAPGSSYQLRSRASTTAGRGG